MKAVSNAQEASTEFHGGTDEEPSTRSRPRWTAVVGEAVDSYRAIIRALALNAPIILAVTLVNTGSDGDWLTWLYASTVALGYYCLPLLIISSLLFLLLAPARRIVVPVVAVFVTTFVLYLVLDCIAYRIVKFHIDPFWIEFFVKDPGAIGLSTGSLVSMGLIVFVVIALEILIFTVAKRIPKRRWLVAAFPTVAVVAFAFSQIVHLVSYEWNDQRITRLTPNFPAYMPITSHKNAAKYKEFVPFLSSSAGAEEQSLHYPLSELQFSDAKGLHNPNVVMILLESWRFDTFDDEVAPNTTALGQESSVFRNHFSTGNQTTCGIFGLYYGLHATYWPAAKANSSTIDNPVLIDAMRDRGYAFGVFAKSNFERHKLKDTIFNGIDVTEDFAGGNNYERDADLTRQTIEFIEHQVKAGRPYYALAFFKSTHAPYEYPKEFNIYDGSGRANMGFTTSSTDPEPYLNHYRNAVRYSDSLVGRIVDRLRELGQMDNTIIVVTTDHGESFNDNRENNWGHGSTFTRYQTQVPLILYVPGQAPRVVTTRTSHVDVAPTIMELGFGCTTPTDQYSNGHNLFDDDLGMRPLAIGSYVNHAYVFGDEVYEILPVFTRKYSLDSVDDDASPPQPEMLSEILAETKRFMAH